MKITNEMIPYIERAMGKLLDNKDFKLYEKQKNYLLDKGNLGSRRCSGRTTAYCIKLALSEGDTLDLTRPEDYSDESNMSSGHVKYSKQYFIYEFVKIRRALKEQGFKVRGIKNRKYKMELFL